VEATTCCGTHVKNLAELQCVKMLQTENVKGQTRLWFVAGTRVVTVMHELFHTSQAVTKTLTCPPESHVERILAMQAAAKAAKKAAAEMAKEIAGFAAAGLRAAVLSQPEGKRLAVLHREGADSGFLGLVGTAMVGSGAVLLLAVGKGKDATFLLATDHDHELATKLTKEVCALIGGKGGGKKGRVQGKCSNIGGLSAAEAYIKKELGIN
jgi:alanyl-tRNA synthetase